MKTALPTVVIEKRLLVREALKSLMASHSCRVVCDVGCTAEIAMIALSDEPKLVILGAQRAADVVDEAVTLRRLWPDIKIFLLFEHAPPADVQMLLASVIDGCVPLSASPEALTSVLDSVIRGTRVMVVPSPKWPEIEPAQPDHSHQPEIALDGSNRGGGEPSAGSISTKTQSNANGVGGRTGKGDMQPQLSQREVQILNGLVKGHANKVIARRCDLAEATVKVHLKSILRKIHVRNRTQAAIWALENGHTAGD
jgi:two-component system nitrate/nitrite response regulator NarL